MFLLANQLRIFIFIFYFFNASHAHSDDELRDFKTNIPLQHSAECFIGEKKPHFTKEDCIQKDDSFYNGKDGTIRYVLKQYGQWSDEKIHQLLNLSSVKQRYDFFLKHNQGPLTLECSKGVEPHHHHCSQPIFGNSQFQIDYLLCPNLAKNYIVLSSSKWTPELDDVFTYCAATWQLVGQCQAKPIMLITKPSVLKNKKSFTLTARELCQFLQIYRLSVSKVENNARYGLYYLSNKR